MLEEVARLQLSLQEENQGHGDIILYLGRQTFATEALPQSVANALRALVHDAAVSETLHRTTTNTDSARYFLGAIERITDPAYLPSDQDLIRVRKSIDENKATTFRIGELMYRLCNMSGQWRGWRKWIHHFEAMKAVVFLVDLSRYDHILEESTSVRWLIFSDAPLRV